MFVCCLLESNKRETDQPIRNWVFATNSNVLIPISLQPDDGILWYFKLDHRGEKKIRVCGKDAIIFSVATHFLKLLSWNFHISLRPDGVNLSYFKLRLFTLNEFKVWNIKGLLRCKDGLENQNFYENIFYLNASNLFLTAELINCILE